MTSQPPLERWPKEQLVREVKRLRAIVFEHAEQNSDRPQLIAGSILDPVGDPNSRGNVIIDVRDAVLMDEVEVAVFDPDPSKPLDTGRVGMSMLLAGRVNQKTERSRQLFLFNDDGAAGIVVQLIALATRVGPEFGARFTASIRKQLAAL